MEIMKDCPEMQCVVSQDIKQSHFSTEIYVPLLDPSGYVARVTLLIATSQVFPA